MTPTTTDPRPTDDATPMPCPFCGELPDVDGVAGEHGHWSIECVSTDCCAFPGVQGDTREVALKLWNTRGPDATLAVVNAVLNRNRCKDECHCDRCREALANAHDGDPCPDCGYTGPLVAMACACYDMSCRGGDLRGSGCWHGSVICPACDAGQADPWEIIREIRAALAPAATAVPASANDTGDAGREMR